MRSHDESIEKSVTCLTILALRNKNSEQQLLQLEAEKRKEQSAQPRGGHYTATERADDHLSTLGY
jgi:hypothetical protein